MKVLIFSAFDGVPYSDEPAMRYAAITEEFLKNGHDVTYITAAFSHLNKKIREVAETPKRLRIVLLTTKPYKSNLSLDRVLSHYNLSITLSEWLKKLDKSNYPDVVIGASPPIFANYVLATFCNRNKIPFIYDLQDLWPEEFVRFLPGKGTLKFLLKPYFSSAEKIVKMATAVTVVSQDYLDYYQKILPAKSKVFYLGTDVEKFVSKSSEGPMHKIMMLGNSQAGNFLMIAARAIQSLPNVQLVIAGLKEKATTYQKQIQKENLQRVKILEWIDPEELYQTLSGFDAGLILTNPESKSAFPNRAFTYFAAGLLVISNIKGGELEKLISENNLGMTIDVQNPVTLKNSIRHCIDNYSIEDRNRIHGFAKDHFSKTVIYQAYYEWVMATIQQFNS